MARAEEKEGRTEGGRGWNLESIGLGIVRKMDKDLSLLSLFIPVYMPLYWTRFKGNKMVVLHFADDKTDISHLDNTHLALLVYI